MTSISNILHTVETYELIKSLTKLHLSAPDEDKVHLEIELESIMESVQTRIIPHIGTTFITKQDMYRYNNQFMKNDEIRIESVSIGLKETIVIADHYGKTVNINLKHFYKLFKGKG